MATVTGYDLIEGTTISPPQLYKTGGSHPESVSPEPLALISFSIGIVALLLSFFRKAALVVAALSLVGTITLILLSFKINNDITGRIELQGLTVEWAVGMYFCLFIFIIGTLLNVYLVFDNRYKTVDLDEVSQRMKICFNCGTANNRSNVSCDKCGNMLG